MTECDYGECHQPAVWMYERGASFEPICLLHGETCAGYRVPILYCEVDVCVNRANWQIVEPATAYPQTPFMGPGPHFACTPHHPATADEWQFIDPAGRWRWHESLSPDLPR